ncbi:HNH endonuclease [Bdellovibrio sp. HCB274]|uniref:HNH endonuclease n=1 Tax=Bdellovibrio sp. HCB274 TaxID=3394361 RepID=UPI0039B591D3
MAIYWMKFALYHTSRRNLLQKSRVMVCSISKEIAMNLKHLDKSELDHRIKTLVQRERELLHEVLLTIKEIDARRTFLELGYGSLFEYLIQGVGYSEGSAQRRIDAARLIREIPEVAIKIQNGELKLNQVSLLQKASREAYKAHATKVTSEQKLEVINSLLKKNHGQTQQQVAAFFDLPSLQSSKQFVQADESVRIELTLTKEVHTKIQRAQELLSHSLPDRDLGQFLGFLAEKVIAQKTGMKLKPPSNKAKSTATVAAENGAKQPAMIVKRIRKQQGCCQYVDKKTGHRCKSVWKLQIDHKQSQWAGGDNSQENLQILCAAHNRMKYDREAGIRYLS